MLKYTGILGGVQGLYVLLSIVRNKLTSILLGVGGMGLIDMYNRTADLICSSTNLGIPFCAVQHISELYDKSAAGKGAPSPVADDAHLAHYVRLVRSWVAYTAVAGFLLTLLLAPAWAYVSLGSAHHATMVMALSPLVAILILSGGEMAVLRGLRQLKSIALITVAGAFTTLLITLPVYRAMGTTGIVPALAASAAVLLAMQWHAARRVMPYRVSLGSWRFLRRGQRMLKLGVGYILAGIVCAGCELLVRSYIVHHGGMADAGLFAVGLTLTVTYTRLVFTSMDADYFPRLSATGGNLERQNTAVNRQIDVLTLLMAPMLMVFSLFLPILVPLLYTTDFVEAIPMVYAALFYMFFKAFSTPIAYLSLARSRSRLYFCVEVSYSLVFLLTAIAGFRLWNVVGVGFALSLSNLVYLIVVWVVYGRAFGFRMNGATLRRSLWHFAILLVGIGACALGNGCWQSYAVATVAAIASVTLSAVLLRKEVPMPNRWRRIFRRR